MRVLSHRHEGAAQVAGGLLPARPVDHRDRVVAAVDGAPVAAPVPCRVRPFKFRASTVDAHLARLTVTDQLRQAADAARRTA